MEKINILDTSDSEYSDDEESINTDDDIVINEGDGEKIDE
jgi:hypothetical protein